MHIACSSADVATQVIHILNQHGISRGICWESASPFDTRVWVIVCAAMDPPVESAIRSDIASIAGAAVQE